MVLYRSYLLIQIPSFLNHLGWNISKKKTYNKQGTLLKSMIGENTIQIYVQSRFRYLKHQISLNIFIFFSFIFTQTMDPNQQINEVINEYNKNYADFYNLSADDLCLCNDFATTLIVDVLVDDVSFKFLPEQTTANPGRTFRLQRVPEYMRMRIPHLMSTYFCGKSQQSQQAYNEIAEIVREYAHLHHFGDMHLRETAVQYALFYVRTFSRDSQFRIQEGRRQYTGDRYFSLEVSASKNVADGHIIRDLLMFTAKIQPMPKRWQVYSVEYEYVGVGPLMYSNHSCTNNCNFTSNRTGNNPNLKTRFYYGVSKGIAMLDEITANYGWKYMKYLDCECETCVKQGRRGRPCEF